MRRFLAGLGAALLLLAPAWSVAETSPDLGVPFLSANQSQPHLTVNQGLLVATIQAKGVVDRGVNTPPASPTSGDAYIIGSSPTGAWAGKANKLAIYYGGWKYLPGADSGGTQITIGARHEGMRVWVNDEDAYYRWDGAAWQLETIGTGDLLSANNLSDLADAATARTNLGLGTIATQAANNVNITGGAISGITDLAVADGGTGASTAANARTNLGLAISTDVQAYDADLSAISALSGTDTIYYRSGAATWSAVTIGTNLTFSSGTLSAAAGATLSIEDEGVELTAAATSIDCVGAGIVCTNSGGDVTMTVAGGSGVADFTDLGDVPADYTGDASKIVAVNSGETALEFVTQASLKPTESIIVAISDETTAITTGTAKVTFRMPYAFTLTAVRASLTTVSSSGTPTFDINEAGSTILSTKLTIDASEKTSTTAASAAVISDTALADDAEMTIDIDTAGTDAAGAKIYLIGHRP